MLIFICLFGISQEFSFVKSEDRIKIKRKEQRHLEYVVGEGIQLDEND